MVLKVRVAVRRISSDAETVENPPGIVAERLLK
jgi:hypothetical protein